MTKKFFFKASLMCVAFLICSEICLASEAHSQSLFYKVFKENVNSKNIVFIHGTPGTGEDFKEYFVDQSLRSRYNMMSVDRLGFGNSDKNMKAGFEVQNVAIKTAVEKEFMHKKVTCVGHSYGGPLCLKLLIDQPTVFENAVIIEGVFNPYRKILKWYNNLANLWLVKLLLPLNLNRSNQEMHGLKKELINLEKNLYKLRGRVKIIHGIEDKIVPVGDGDWLYNKIKGKNVERLRVEKAGHFIIWKDFDLIKKELIKFY